MEHQGNAQWLVHTLTSPLEAQVPLFAPSPAFPVPWGSSVHFNWGLGRLPLPWPPLCVFSCLLLGPCWSLFLLFSKTHKTELRWLHTGPNLTSYEHELQGVVREQVHCILTLWWATIRKQHQMWVNSPSHGPCYLLFTNHGEEYSCDTIAWHYKRSEEKCILALELYRTHLPAFVLGVEVTMACVDIWLWLTESK